MIALAISRKNFAGFVSNPNLFLCKSQFPFFLPIHNFATSIEKQIVASSTTVYDVLVHNHHFSPDFASLAISYLTRHCSPERVDSVVSFLKENGFSITQLEKSVAYKPRILGVSDEDIKFILKIFQDLGFSSEEVAKLVSRNPSILLLDARDRIIPTLAVLKGLLGSDHNVARVLRISSWFLLKDVEKTLVPNVEILKRCGIPMKHICYFMYKFPRCLLKSDVLTKSIDKVREMGATLSPKMFILAVGVIASSTEESWELKWRALRDLGFSDSDLLEMFKKAPPAFCVSTEKIKKVTELLLATGKFDMSSIVYYPTAFGRSIEKRYKPRLQILEILESRNLIKKWPSLSTIAVFPDDRFIETFVEPYSDELDKNILLRFMPKANGR